LEQHKIQIYSFPESELEPEVGSIIMIISNSINKIFIYSQTQWMRERLPFAVVMFCFTS
jgi:hypothetical protein